MEVKDATQTTAQAFVERRFEVEVEGEQPQQFTLAEMIAGNRDDTELVSWLCTATVGAQQLLGGGAAPAFAITRLV